MHSSVAQLSHEVRRPHGKQLASMTRTGSQSYYFICSSMLTVSPPTVSSFSPEQGLAPRAEYRPSVALAGCGETRLSSLQFRTKRSVRKTLWM